MTHFNYSQIFFYLVCGSKMFNVGGKTLNKTVKNIKISNIINISDGWMDIIHGLFSF